MAPLGPLERVEEWDGLPWVVRPVSGAAARKAYRCPGCDHEVAAGTPHQVVWPADGPLLGGAGEDGPGDRRHWHTACWRSRHRRRPRRR